MKWEDLLALAIVLSFFFVCALNMNNKIPDYDESVYYYHGRLILHPELYDFCTVDPQRCDVYPPKALGPLTILTFTDHPPLGKYIIAFAFWINETLFTGRLITLLFGCATVLLTYLIAKKFYGSFVGLLSAFFIASSLSFTSLSILLFHDVPMSFFVVSSIYFFYIDQD